MKTISLIPTTSRIVRLNSVRVARSGSPWSKRSWNAAHHENATISRVHEELPEPVRREELAHQTRLGTAERTTSTTRSCASAGIPGQSGSEKFSAPACSVAGSDPGS